MGAQPLLHLQQSFCDSADDNVDLPGSVPDSVSVPVSHDASPRDFVHRGSLAAEEYQLLLLFAGPVLQLQDLNYFGVAAAAAARNGYPFALPWT